MDTKKNVLAFNCNQLNSNIQLAREAHTHRLATDLAQLVQPTVSVKEKD